MHLSGNDVRGRSRGRPAWLLAMAGVRLVACGSDPHAAVSSAPNAGQVEQPDFAPVPIVLRRPDDNDLDHVSVGGVLAVDGSCLYLDGPPGNRNVVAWPHGTKWDASSRSVTRPGGIGPHNDPAFSLSDGEYLVGAGTVVEIADASALVLPDSRRLLEDCLEGGVAMIQAGIRSQAPPDSTPPTTKR